MPNKTSSRRSATRLDREIRAALAAPRSSVGFRVAYLVPNPRRGQPGQEAMLRLWWADEGAPRSMTEALAELRQARARGYTAWVADAAGAHVPVKGAVRPYPGSYSTS